MMKRKPAGVLMFLLVILKVLVGTAEAACSCTASVCHCHSRGLTSVPQDLPTTITRLNLKWNQITTLSQPDFSRYRSLETLQLDNNRISIINSQAFYHLSNLTTLWLFWNRLTILRSDMFDGLGNLEELHLYYNDISDIQAGTFNPTQQVRHLYLYGNKLTHLRPDMFTGLGNSWSLYLHDNKISDIESGTFNPIPQLRNLQLQSNKLITLRAGMFTGLGNLQTLYLYTNDITDIQAGTFSPMQQLRYLELQRNKLISLRADMFTGLGNLYDLQLDHNEIDDIQIGTFDSQPQLRFLKLSDNSITTFPFDELSRLQRLYRLDLYNNQMTTLPSVAYDVLSSIADVQIHNNPWQCDCRVVDFRLKMTGLRPFENQITCSQPNNFYGQNLISINPEDLICEEPTIARFQTIVNIPLVQGSINLFCEASGIPTPDITVTLPSGLNATVLSVGRVSVDVNGNIVIRNATSADVGLYTCIAANLVGSTFARLSIDVDEPTIVRFNRVNTVVQEETLRLVCEASGIPTPDITVILPSGQHATVDMNGIITIRDVTAADAGLYVCIVTNLAGSTFATLVVDLQTVPTVTLPVLLGAVCGSIAGTVIIGGIILAIWCKRNNQSPPKGPDFSVVYNNTNATATIVTNGQDLTVPTETMSGSSDAKDTHLVPRPASSQFKPQYEDVKALARHAVPRQTARGLSSDVRNPQLVSRPASSQVEPQYEVVMPPARHAVPRQTARGLSSGIRNPRPATSLFEPYDDVLPPQRGVVPSQTARGQALQPLNGSNNEPPPLPRASTASAPGYENIPEHIYQSLSMNRNRPDNGQDNLPHYQPLRRTSIDSENSHP